MPTSIYGHHNHPIPVTILAMHNLFLVSVERYIIGYVPSVLWNVIRTAGATSHKIPNERENKLMADNVCKFAFYCGELKCMY